jgi:hypothetical protein
MSGTSGPTTLMHDPTAELAATIRPRRTPPESLDGRTVALFDIGKTRSDEFLDSLEALLNDRGITTARYAKPTNAKIAPIETLQAVATEADLVVSALAD